MPSPWLSKPSEYPLTASDVARRLRITVADVYMLVKVGVLPGKRVDRMGIATFRFKPSEVDRYKVHQHGG